MPRPLRLLSPLFLACLLLPPRADAQAIWNAAFWKPVLSGLRSPRGVTWTVQPSRPDSVKRTSKQVRAGDFFTARVEGVNALCYEAGLALNTYVAVASDEAKALEEWQARLRGPSAPPPGGDFDATRS